MNWTLFVFLVVVGCASAALDRFNARVVPSHTLITKSEKGMTFTFPNGTVEIVAERAHSYLPIFTSKVGASEPDGWRTSAWSWGTNYNYFTASWNVPAAPTTTNGQCLFFFNSFQHESGGILDILQPVMQYNCNGHPGWTVASWYGSSQYVQSPSAPIKTGDTVVGVMEVRSNVWHIEAYVAGNLIAHLAISNTRGNSTYYQTMNSAQVALEMYSVRDCSYYPSTNTVEWTQMSIKDQGQTATPKWGPSNNPTSCNAVTKCASASECTTSWTH